MQHIAWPMQHGIIFTYVINGCSEISFGGSSGLKVPKREREKEEREYIYIDGRSRAEQSKTILIVFLLLRFS